MNKFNTQQYISIRGAREHNLKNVSLDLPKDKLIVFTGVSGSGKSSLAFDTIFAEGQRRFVESLSAYARQFLGQKEKPDVDSIDGIMPSISIDQKAGSHNPRSTVATITEIYDYLRVLFARVGDPYCPRCDTKIEKMTSDEIVDYIFSFADKLEIDKKISILAPIVRERKGEYHQLLYDLYTEGFSQVAIDGVNKSLAEHISLARYKAHSIDVVIDQFELTKDLSRTRITEAVEQALDKGNKTVKIEFPLGAEVEKFKEISAEYSCPKCNYSFPEIEPRLFSFNSPVGACSHCHGLGIEYFWSNQPCSICDGARLRPESLSVKIDEESIYSLTTKTIRQAKSFIDGLKLDQRKSAIAEGLVREIINRLTFLLDVGLDYISLDRKAGTLSGGEAQRIRLASQIGTKLTGVLYVLDEPTIGLHQRDNEKLVKTLVALRDIGNTVIVVEHDEEMILSSDYLVDIGPEAGLAGGKIVVAGETEKLLSKNPIATIGDPAESITLQYLTGQKKIDLPKKRRSVRLGHIVTLVGATHNNLKNITVDFPLGLFICVTGVSGSGKSTLVDDVFTRALKTQLLGEDYKPGKFKEIKNLQLIDKLIAVDQSPIGRTPRSNPATYTGIFTPIRDLFTILPESKKRGYRPGRFSFNVSTAKGGGRCEACEGDGYQKIEMHFLPDVFVPCPVCKGKRFSRETLEVKYKNKNISEILELTIAEAEEFFTNIPQINNKLKTLNEVGLGYIKLGQSAPTLSGGEAQRVKLSAELAKRSTGRTIYILDEPTVGLHYADVKQLLEVLHRLVNKGNTVIVIEHNLDVIKQADWIIDLGPEGGDGGGRLVSAGPPETIAKNKNSYTGQWLKHVL